jgi:hypothetical protein
VLWYDELELQSPRQNDDYGAHSFERSPPPTLQWNYEPSTPYILVIYNRAPACGPQVAEDERIVIVESESEVINADTRERIKL